MGDRNWYQDSCLQSVKNELADVAFGRNSILTELCYLAVDDAFSDAEGGEEVLEEAVIPVAQKVE